MSFACAPNSFDKASRAFANVVRAASLEMCDSIDNNCDGQIDEDSAFDAPLWYEDLDGDGIEDAHDHDDDGDGFAAAEEIAKGTDPRDPEAVPNLPPTDSILEGNQLSENLPAGSVVG